VTLPVSGQTRARVLQLHEQGVGRNEIARITGISTASVSKIVKEEGGSFDTSQTELATQNRMADLAERRAIVSEKFLTRANSLLDDMEREFRAFAFGGKDNVYTEQILEEPSVEAKHTMIRAASTAMKAHTDLVKFDSDQGQARAESLLDALAAGIGAAAEILNGPAGEGDSEAT